MGFFLNIFSSKDHKYFAAKCGFFFFQISKMLFFNIFSRINKSRIFKTNRYFFQKQSKHGFFKNNFSKDSFSRIKNGIFLQLLAHERYFCIYSDSGPDSDFVNRNSCFKDFLFLHKIWGIVLPKNGHYPVKIIWEYFSSFEEKELLVLERSWQEFYPLKKLLQKL